MKRETRRYRYFTRLSIVRLISSASVVVNLPPFSKGYLPPPSLAKTPQSISLISKFREKKLRSRVLKMGTKVSDHLLSTVRSVVGSDYSDMDIIRALHMANLDPTAAINIIFDTPSFSKPNDIAVPAAANSTPRGFNGGRRVEDGLKVCPFSEGAANHHRVEEEVDESVSGDECWWFVGCSELSGLSTCKGRRLKAGDELLFTFPSSKALKSEATMPGKRFGRGRPSARNVSDIVRFSTKDSGEVCLKLCSFLTLVVMLNFFIFMWQIGRIPNEWAKCLLPLVRDKKVRIEGRCKSAPESLGIMDTILLSVRYTDRLLLLDWLFRERWFSLF